jgi:hypothetical protein
VLGLPASSPSRHHQRWTQLSRCLPTSPKRKSFQLRQATTINCKFADYIRRSYVNDSARSEENAVKSSLLRLPAELRCKIYDYVRDRAVIYASTSTKGMRTFSSTTPLRQASRQLYGEVPIQGHEAVVILREGYRLNLVLKLLGLKQDVFSRTAK